ncbi:hypothetical protein VM98_38710, partial [Streptomyces rubellomurinus subsp. indigoferus]
GATQKRCTGSRGLLHSPAAACATAWIAAKSKAGPSTPRRHTCAGLQHGAISAHLADVYGSEVSQQTISTLTDQVIEGMAEWQNRPLDSVYPVVFIDCVHVKL